MKNWKTLKKELLKNKKVAEEYKRLEPRYQLISELIEARVKKGLTQEQLAKKMGTKQSAIARLESGNTNPSINFLEEMAAAIGSKLVVQIK
jgi:ribosome-binding protein aMBF1 (putative translation factor)